MSLERDRSDTSDAAPESAAGEIQSQRERSPREELRKGAVVGRYVIDSRAGQGGMGAVYRARDTVLGRVVALKVIRASRGGAHAEAESAERLVREARAAAALDHPNAVAIFDASANPFASLHGRAPVSASYATRPHAN